MQFKASTYAQDSISLVPRFFLEKSSKKPPFDFTSVHSWHFRRKLRGWCRWLKFAENRAFLEALCPLRRWNCRTFVAALQLPSLFLTFRGIPSRETSTWMGYVVVRGICDESSDSPDGRIDSWDTDRKNWPRKRMGNFLGALFRLIVCSIRFRIFSIASYNVCANISLIRKKCNR